MKEKSILADSLVKYITRKFKHGFKITSLNNGFKIGSVSLEANFGVVETFTLLIEPEGESALVKSILLDRYDYNVVSELLESFYTAQQQSAIVDVINSLE